jgi:predicted transcriptional regulator
LWIVYCANSIKHRTISNLPFEMEHRIAMTESLDERVYAALKQSGGTVEHIAKSVGVPRAEVAQALERLRQAGRAQRRWKLIARGAHDWSYYAAAEGGAAA